MRFNWLPLRLILALHRCLARLVVKQGLAVTVPTFMLHLPV
jgi:hypothetical protein